jgi:hypothetical protein
MDNEHRPLPKLINQQSGDSHLGDAAGGQLPPIKREGTTTILPLKKQMQGQGGALLRRRFEDIQPSLLLFLQRLRRIVVSTSLSVESCNSHGASSEGCFQYVQSTGCGVGVEDKQMLNKIMVSYLSYIA